MTEEEYITQRLDEQMTYYSAKSAKNKTYYFRSKVITIILSASLPFITTLPPGNILNTPFTGSHLVGLIGVVIAVLSGITGLFKYHETWINYRKIKEQLEREKIMYQTQSGSYENNTNFKLFVSNVEKIMDAENNSWLGYNQLAQQGTNSLGNGFDTAGLTSDSGVSLG